MSAYHTEKKQENIKKLLQYLQDGHSYEDIAKYLNVSTKCVCKYIKELRESKSIYVCSYLKTKGSLKKVYKAGNKADEPRPVYRRKIKERVVRKFIARPDIAASWMYNPC